MSRSVATSRSSPIRKVQDSLAKPKIMPYADHMPVLIEPALFLAELSKMKKAHFTLSEIEQVLEQHRSNALIPEALALLIPEGLQVPPPPPSETYGGHWYRLPQRLEAESFLATYWSDYTVKHPHWLFAPHLREHDSALDAALRNRARALGESFDNFFFRNGVLTQTHVLSSSPDASIERQCTVFRQMVALRRLASMSKASNHLIER